jgi:hypothetical protein
MRYELIRVAQLVFALSLIGGAFLAGLGIGWWRWGKRTEESVVDTEAHVPPPRPVHQHQVKSDLFGPDDVHGHAGPVIAEVAIAPARRKLDAVVELPMTQG